MNQVLEVLKYLLPSLVVFITAYALIRMFLDDIKNKPQPAVKENDAPDLLTIETHKALLPLKLQAYERIILYLERINPESLIMRNHRSGMTALDIQRELLKNIREEFEHNHSQQLYLNPETWDAVRNAKEEMTKLVKLAGTQVEISTSALAYSETFLKMAAQLSQLPTNFAMEKLRAEMKQL
jgi:6-phosphogluconate dehydrogenase